MEALDVLSANRAALGAALTQPSQPDFNHALSGPGHWEGTNISEGRGTTQPFELFGAPFLEPAKILDFLGAKPFPGIVLRETAFEPTANKWQGALCRGFQIHVQDTALYRPYTTTLELLRAVLACHAGDLQWKPPPYEYEMEKMPVDLIIGDRSIRKRLENLDPVDVLETSWIGALDEYKHASRVYYLYDE